MNDTSSDNGRNLEASVTKAGEAIGGRVQSVTTATAAAAGQAQKMVQDITATTSTAAAQAKKVLGDAGEAAQEAWSQAGGVAEDVVDAGRRATRSGASSLFVSRTRKIVIFPPSRNRAYAIQVKGARAAQSRSRNCWSVTVHCCSPGRVGSAAGVAPAVSSTARRGARRGFGPASHGAR